MARLVKFVLALLAGTAIGLGAAYFAVGGQPPFGAVRSGAWTAWPGSGSPESDPYARAIFAHDGRIQLAAAEGLRFFAAADDAGVPLDAGCTYEVGGPTAAAEFWTLTLLDPQGFVEGDPAARSGFTSAELVRASDGAFAMTVARRARPGNWLPVGADGPFMLMLSFYDTPLSTALQTGSPAPSLPSVVKRSCP